MATFGILVDDDKEIKQFMRETKTRLGENNLLKNPFNGVVERFKTKDDKVIYLMIMNPVYFNFSMLAWFPFLGMLYFMGATYWLLIPGFVISLGIFWSKWFYAAMFKLALRTRCKNYKLIMSSTKILERIYLNGAR